MQTNIAPIPTTDQAQEHIAFPFPESTLLHLDLSEETTIDQLPSYHYQVEDNTIVQQVEKTLRAYPEWPGVIVTHDASMIGMISRRRFFEILGTRYGVAVFLQRPIEIMVKHVTDPLILPGSCYIDEAVRETLKRENSLIYEPILVKCEKSGFHLLDIYMLLLAQSQLYAALQMELQSVNVNLENRVIRRTDQLTQANTQLNREVAERKRAEKHLKIRFRYEQTVARAADSLLAAVDKPEVILKTLRRLLKTTKVSRVYLIEYVVIEGEEPCMRLLHQVCTSGVQPIPQEFQILPHKKYQGWLDTLWSGKSLMGNLSTADGHERQLLDEFGIQSFLLLPVGKPGEWYGMIGLDETAVIRDWSQNDIQLLQTVARMLYTYIERQRSRQSLTQAKDEAVKANQFKTELMAKVNHELRTPLGAIMGYAQLLQFGSYGPILDEQKDPLALIISSSNYLNTLVSSLLDQALIEKGKLILEALPVQMSTLIAEVDSRTRILAEKTGLEFKINITPDFPEEIIGDITRIQQIWTNLLTNAIKFTEEGYIHTFIRRYGADQWVIEVVDTGKGIPKEFHKYIFDAFVQVDGSPTRQRSGTGLGLSISASIIEMMGGRIHLHSEVDRGTTFIVYLPLQLINKNPGEPSP